MTRHVRKLLLLLAATLALAAFFAAGCGDDDDDGDEPTPAQTAPTGGSPQTPTDGDDDGDGIDISGIEELEDGTLTIGSDIAYAPIEFYDENNNPVGLDVDLAEALGQALGVEIEFENAGFDSLLPSLDAERYDIIMSSMSVNPERSQVVDFVEYFNAGIGMIVAAGNPENIATFDDLCGKTVAVQKGTIQVDFLRGTTEAPGGKNGECEAADRGSITVLEFDTDPEAVQALIAGQAAAELADFPVAAYSASQNEGEVDLVETQVEPGPYGIAVRKSSTALRDALQDALDQIIEDGTYDTILEKWDLSAGSIESD
jgi:polar amino acid transport system substrate-binding protein